MGPPRRCEPPGDTGGGALTLSVADAIQLGVRFQQQGDLDGAVAIYRVIGIGTANARDTWAFPDEANLDPSERDPRRDHPSPGTARSPPSNGEASSRGRPGRGTRGGSLPQP